MVTAKQKTIRVYVRCSSCGSPDVRWLIHVTDGSKTKWCEECAYQQLQIRYKHDASKHMELLDTRRAG